MTGSIALIQPRHCYADPHSAAAVLGHIYFPTALYVMAARMRAVGLDVKVYDENVSRWNGPEEVAGIASIGSPYMAAIASRLSELREQGLSKLIVGGQGIRGLAEDEFAKIFGATTMNGSIDAQLVLHGVTPRLPPDQEGVSIAGELAELSDDTFNLYFSREVPLYLSQGCRYSCTFCGAERSSPATKLAVRETYRDIACVEAELTTIMHRSQRLGIPQNSFYLSNLDLFQETEKLSRFVDCVRSVRAAFPNQQMRFRGLSTTNSFLAASRKSPDLISSFVEVGLERVGFGIDGATPDVWRKIRKPHTKDSCLRAVAVARTDFGLQPEALMVFGHDGHDNAESLSLAVSTVKRLSDDYGAIPRPHVAKGLVPGNDGWKSGGWQKQYLLDNPWAFQFLDFTCLPTDLTHQSSEFRDAVKSAFLEICAMPNCLTRHVLPEDRRLTQDQLRDAIQFNRGRFDI